eukprot:NODE_401_length_1739_cov_385.283432_g295_i0.p1 GENE.NODE_401_length_1739_cov_385.283432_g295_i0~~NODE_401_length_1739_cov_385.283432_g295_i0.p1  ORF type:complete len:487 (-),score=131.14 NODE_401_length_1739_cov_385.283432_g295_i0:277-1683(-)
MESPKKTEETAPAKPEIVERYPFSQANGRKVYSIKGTKFDVPEKYVITARLGQGSYGMVVQATNSETGGEKVAIKKCGSLFKYPEDGKRILREIKLMQMLNHRNILTILDVLPPTQRTFEDVYIVTTCSDTDLSNIIRSQTLSEGHCKYIIYQILRGLKYIHSANILHRDLKPANILINFDCRIKICDFGLARGADPSKKQNLTNYVVTRWYRAPELLLDNTRYTSAIDIWASGCIFAEMLRGSAMFPGESSLDQMHRVADAVGVPPDDDLWWIQSAKAREYLKSRGGKENSAPNKDLKSRLPPDTKPMALDFIKHMLAFNPYKRWSADWLLDHPHLADCHRPESCYRASQQFKWKWDSDYPDEQQLRKLFWEEALVFHPELESLPPAPTPAPASSVSIDKLNRVGSKENLTVKPKEVKREKPVGRMVDKTNTMDAQQDGSKPVERMDCRRIVQQIVESRKTPEKAGV